jgi:hypothetical protein
MSNPTNFWDFAVWTIVVLYNLSIIGGTAYLVAERGWSGWWFLFAIILLGNAKTGSFSNVTGN